ncbi:hypothetical protein FH972_024537 [Carpinus fangiana]|uniref:Survival protein SurE-like phosphatase/nucleotidase domain-containing protein n=1 Tax=Carpinus fangiana TaxID=176857 RepID=A0A5N6KZ17_9ROSI|nr:hypothetical protein FH972_024537 [Carpinus fangiana]
MHILLTNDDGPPNAESSPNVLSFARALRAPPFNHTVSVVLPSTQRSWIGKAHLLPASKLPLAHQQQPSTRPANENVTDHVTPTYYDPETGTAHPSPPEDPNKDYWVLVPGTPATCVQLGLFHHSLLFPITSTAPGSLEHTKDTPIDFVVSGPNHGRNTTAAFALSSGTLGGALEAAVVGVRSIAVSFAFFNRDEIPLLVDEACDHSARIVTKLMTDWDANQQRAKKEGIALPDVYSVNVPLTAGLTEKPIRWTWMLDNKWQGGSLYKILPHEPTALEEAIKNDAEDAGSKAEKSSQSAGESGKLPPTAELRDEYHTTAGQF